jgi:phage-related minor tail protein
MPSVPCPGAFIFEDVGVTAYGGGLPILTTPAFRAAATGILAAEAYHAGAVRLALRNKNGVRTGYAGTTVKQLIGLIAALRDAADGQPGTQDAPLAKLVPADANGIAYVRSVSGVLRIVYLGGINRGGFFPRGLNGRLRRA